MLVGKLSIDGHLASQTLKAVVANVSHATLNNRAREHNEDACTGTVAMLQNPGERTLIPRQYELALVELVQKLRKLKLKAGKSLLVGAAKFLKRGTDWERAFKDQQVKYSWYYSFRKCWAIKMKS